MKKEYTTPQLECFGPVSELSAGGSADGIEGLDISGAARRP